MSDSKLLQNLHWCGLLRARYHNITAIVVSKTSECNTANAHNPPESSLAKNSGQNCQLIKFYLAMAYPTLACCLDLMNCRWQKRENPIRLLQCYVVISTMILDDEFHVSVFTDICSILVYICIWVYFLLTLFVIVSMMHSHW